MCVGVNGIVRLVVTIAKKAVIFARLFLPETILLNFAMFPKFLSSLKYQTLLLKHNVISQEGQSSIESE
jgi:hypothetical protein